MRKFIVICHYDGQKDVAYIEAPDLFDAICTEEIFDTFLEGIDELQDEIIEYTNIAKLTAEQEKDLKQCMTHLRKIKTDEKYLLEQLDDIDRSDSGPYWDIYEVIPKGGGFVTKELCVY